MLFINLLFVTALMTIGTYHHANASIILKPRADDDGLNDIDINVTDEVYVSEPAFVRRASDPNKRKSRDSSPEKKNDKNSAKSTPPPSRPSSSHKVDVSLHHNAGNAISAEDWDKFTQSLQKGKDDGNKKAIHHNSFSFLLLKTQ